MQIDVEPLTVAVGSDLTVTVTGADVAGQPWRYEP